jgi:phosphoglucosamine mutase
VAGEDLTAELAVRLGRSATLNSGSDRPQVLVVRDTRESGPMLEAALAAGVASGGGDALVAGVLPTPAASVLSRRYGFDLAAVVSASHNPFRDNGIKFFSGDGMKLTDEAEAEIEARLEEAGRSQVGRVHRLEGALDDYVRELRTSFGLDLRGTRVVLDCANGATYRAAPAVFERLGATVEAMGVEPDGRNINDGCGSTHPEAMIEAVQASGADLGFAFDGDGDRVVAADATGRLRDGDEVLALIAAHLAERGELGGGVAVTVMTNHGFHRAMAEAGIEVAETNVGDRYLLEALRDRDWLLGGEQSGHVIWRNFTPTGDGVATALHLIRALGGRSLAEAQPFERMPQRLDSVEVADRSVLRDAEPLWDAVDEANSKLEGRGRVLVRPSGTEPLLRLMVEASDEAECERTLARLLEVARQELGGA